MQSDHDVVQLHIKLGSLLKQHSQLILHNNRLVDLLEKLRLGWVVTHLAQNSTELGCVVLDDHSDLLFLLLDGLVLSKVFSVLGLKRLENFSLASRSLVNTHQFLYGVDVIVHCHAVLHDLFLLLTALFQESELLLNFLHSWVVLDVRSICRLGDHSGQLLARLA